MNATRIHPRGPFRAITVLGMLALSACSGSPATVGPTGTDSQASVSARPSATASTPASPAPPSASVAGASVAFAFASSQPVVTRDLVGSDALYINPGAVIDEGGRLHMYANVFSAWPGHVDMPHLVSTDGASWTPATTAPVLTSDDIPFTTSGADVSTGFVAPDGTWVLIVESVENGVPWKLGRATAPGPDGPWKVDPDPILEPGPAGAWDAGGLSWPSVVATAAGYSMYFTGLDQPYGKGAIGLATSTDGKSWTKHDGPVFVAGAPWELGKLDRPRVAVTPRGLAMVYAGGQLTDRGLAWSDDGLTWRRDGAGPVISQDRFPIQGKAWDAALTYRDNRLEYYLEIGSGSGSVGTNVYLATAPLP
jgi:predicted GH43/DUF377 family glycosyl hydrolase